MKMEYVYMLACHQGKEAVIGKLKDIMNDIQASKFTVSFSEIRFVKLNTITHCISQIYGYHIECCKCSV